MAITNTFLFYRTPATRILDIPDPENLPNAQKLLFVPSNDMANNLNEEWRNNIVRKTPPKPGGRKIIQTDEGLISWLPVISGTFSVKFGETKDKIHSFRKQLQSDSYHKSGIFGLVYPDGPDYTNIDPTDKLGFMIEFTRGKHVGNTKEVMDFAIGLSYGGEII